MLLLFEIPLTKDSKEKLPTGKNTDQISQNLQIKVKLTRCLEKTQKNSPFLANPGRVWPFREFSLGRVNFGGGEGGGG